MSALADYYRAQANEFNARVPLIAAQTGQIADDSASKRTLEASSANLTNAQANATQAASPANVAETMARATNLGATTDATRSASASSNLTLPLDLQTKSLTNQGLATNLAGLSSDQIAALQQLAGGGASNGLGSGQQLQKLYTGAAGFAKGGIVGRDNVKPAAGDTVPAMLKPGEAVLNKGAVNHYGTDVIDHMNGMGMLHTKAHGEITKLIKTMGDAGKKKAARKKA